MKKIFYLFIFSLLISCTARAQSEVIETSLELIDNKSVISLFWNKNNERILIKEFNYIRLYNRRIFTFSNESIVGYLPVKNFEAKVKHHNDLNHDFNLFYCNSKNGTFITLGESVGWNFHIIDSEELKSRWIVTTEEEANFFLLDQDGIISNEVIFPITFSPDNVKIKERSGDNITLLFGILGKDAIYEIDFKSKTGHLIDEYETEAH